MHVPRGYQKTGGVDHETETGRAQRDDDPPIGPSRVGQLALDTSHGFGRADDVNPYLHDPTTNWLLERMREHLEDIANRDSPGNVFNMAVQGVIPAGGSLLLNWPTIPVGAFWYVDRLIAYTTKPTIPVFVYASMPGNTNPGAGSQHLRDYGVSDSNSGILVFPSKHFPLFLAGGEWLSVGVTSTAGDTLMANAQFRQFNK